MTKHFPHPLTASTIQVGTLFELMGSKPSLKNTCVFIPYGLDGVWPAWVSRKYCPCDPEDTGDTFAPCVPSQSREWFGAQPSLQPGLFKGKEKKRWEGSAVFITPYKTKVEILFLP